MIPYRNLSGRSGIVSYETTDDSIHVLFRGERHYRYDHTRPGKADVERMKALAEQGQGLGTYISQTVKNRYADKW